MPQLGARNCIRAVSCASGLASPAVAPLTPDYVGDEPGLVIQVRMQRFVSTYGEFTIFNRRASEIEHPGKVDEPENCLGSVVKIYIQHLGFLPWGCALGLIFDGLASG
jgi:hypothetical protein